MWLKSFQTGRGSAPKLELAPVLRCLCLCCAAVIGIGKTCHYSGLQFPHGSRWEEECNTCQCVNGKVECTKVSVWMSKHVKNKSFFLFLFLELNWCDHDTFFSSGGVWPAAVPVARDAWERASLLFRRSWMPGAQLPDVPLPPLSPVGVLFKPWLHPNHPNKMWAQLSLSGQELCSHHPNIQQGQITHSKYSP